MIITFYLPFVHYSTAFRLENTATYTYLRVADRKRESVHQKVRAAVKQGRVDAGAMRGACVVVYGMFCSFIILLYSFFVIIIVSFNLKPVLEVVGSTPVEVGGIFYFCLM